MSKVAKTLERIVRGDADSNIRFSNLCSLLNSLGFAERIRGDHHIFTRDGIAEILNLQPRSGKAKAYQVKQVRDVLVSNGLAGKLDIEETSSDSQTTENSDSEANEDGGHG